MASLRKSGDDGGCISYLSIASENGVDDFGISTKRKYNNNAPSSWTGNLCGNHIDYNLNPIVFIISTVIIWSFVVWCLVNSSAFMIMSDLQNYLVKYFSWLYIGSVVVFMLFMAFLLLHPKYSKIKLGKNNEKPKYNLVTWFAMLFSAGFGSGMYFYGLAEPVLHFRDAVEGYNRYSNLPRQQQAVSSLNLTWFHGSFACLSIYCTVGVLIGFLSHKHDFPMTMRTCFFPLIDNKIYGTVGDIIDISAVVATMFGLTTGLGMGVMQINSGLTRVFGTNLIPNNSNTQIIILWIITITATISVVTGIDKGIKRLSQLNFGFGCILLLYLLFVGDTFFVLNLFLETLGYHFSSFLVTLCDTDAFEQSGFDEQSNPKAWMSWWTVFYWGWWIAWSPFVGIFIAQISRGRTIREFILYNTLVPAFAVYSWCAIMGGLGIELEWHALNNNIGNDCYYNSAYNGTITDGKYTRLSCANISDQLFILIEYYPLADFMSLITIIAIVGYFVTSSDSASYVIDLITSNGTEHTPKLQRIFWALTEGAVTSALFGGGDSALEALQTVSIVSALPFTFVLLAIVYATLKALNMDESELKQNQKIDDSDVKYIVSTSIDNDYQPEIEHVDDETKIWRVEFFDGLFNGFCVCMMAIVAPCVLQFRNGKKIGLYGNGQCCNDFIWVLFVFIPPILFIVLHLLQLFGDGYAYLAWVVYIGFVSVGAYHRMKIREYYHLKGNAFADTTSYCCCYCFAVAQESLQCKPTALL